MRTLRAFWRALFPPAQSTTTGPSEVCQKLADAKTKIGDARTELVQEFNDLEEAQAAIAIANELLAQAEHAIDDARDLNNC